MIPFSPQLLIFAIVAATSFGAGWKVQSWRWDASLKAEAEKRVAAVNQARAREHEMAAVQETIATTLERSKADALRKKDAVIADLRSGALRLPINPSVPGPGETPAAAGKCDGGTTTELPRAVAEFLLSEATRADGVVAQLQACQSILRAR